MGKSKGVERLSNGYSIEAAIDVLTNNLKEIPDAKTWAEWMGYSRSHFSTKIKKHFGESPFQILVNVRVKQIHKEILAHPRKTSFSVARIVGLKDDDALYQFLSNHYNTNFTKLREKLLSSDEF